MGSVVVQLVGLINGGTTAFDGQYLVEYDPGRDGIEPSTGRTMMCHLVTTSDRAQAFQFDDAAAAFETWQLVDPRKPVRVDGKPNRPLTAFTVGIEAVGG